MEAFTEEELQSISEIFSSLSFKTGSSQRMVLAESILTKINTYLQKEKPKE